MWFEVKSSGRSYACSRSAVAFVFGSVAYGGQAIDGPYQVIALQYSAITTMPHADAQPAKAIASRAQAMT
jgi:hypothetical protein